MSLYDIAVKKMGFPKIELFVKVSNVVTVCKSAPILYSRKSVSVHECEMAGTLQ